MNVARVLSDFHSIDILRSAHGTVVKEMNAFHEVFNGEDLGQGLSAVSSVIGNGILSRIKSIFAACLCLYDFVKGVAVVRVFTPIAILFDSGITPESLARTAVAIGIIILKAALRCASSALSIILPELTLGLFKLHQVIMELDALSIGLRLNLEESGIGQSERGRLNGEVDLWTRWTFRTNFASRCANFIAVEHDRPRRYSSSIINSLNELGYYLDSNNVVRSRRDLRNQRNSELAETPFCSEFLKEIESEGNLLIDQGLYTRDDVEDFSTGYQAVCNRAIFKALIHLFDCTEEGQLIYRESGAEVSEEDVIDQMSPHIDSIRKVVLSYKDLSKHVAQAQETEIDEVQAAVCEQVLWQLCFDQDDILKKLDHVREEFDQFKDVLAHSSFETEALQNLKEILLIVPNLRIELVERSLLNNSESRTSSISEQFQAACARLKNTQTETI